MASSFSRVAFFFLFLSRALTVVATFPTLGFLATLTVVATFPTLGFLATLSSPSRHVKAATMGMVGALLLLLLLLLDGVIHGEGKRAVLGSI